MFHPREAKRTTTNRVRGPHSVPKPEVADQPRAVGYVFAGSVHVGACRPTRALHGAAQHVQGGHRRNPNESPAATCYGKLGERQTPL